MHIVALNDMKQQQSETVKSYSARVRGTAANCNLSKKCPNTDCDKEVPYLEETCYHVVISGLFDSDMKDRCLTQAMLGNVSDLTTLVNYCTAEESGKCVAQTVGAVKKSTYKGGSDQTPPPSRCGFCGDKQHGAGTRLDREKMCK